MDEQESTITAVAADDILKGQLVKLIAVPLYQDEHADGMSQDSVNAGEKIRVSNGRLTD